MKRAQTTVSIELLQKATLLGTARILRLETISIAEPLQNRQHAQNP